MKGVRPEEADSVSTMSDPGSKNRTRFVDRFGVAGGVDIPCGREFTRTIGCEFDCDWILGPLTFRLFRRTAMGLSSLTILS
jgi:hypothetical protein